MILSPPTLCNLHDLLAFRDKEALRAELDRRRWGPPRSPRPILFENTVLNILPWDPMFERADDIDTSTLDLTPAPRGEAVFKGPFERGNLAAGGMTDGGGKANHEGTGENHMNLPEKGLAKEDVFRQLREYRRNDLDTHGGRTWAYVYDHGRREVEDAAKESLCHVFVGKRSGPNGFSESFTD